MISWNILRSIIVFADFDLKKIILLTKAMIRCKKKASLSNLLHPICKTKIEYLSKLKGSYGYNKSNNPWREH